MSEDMEVGSAQPTGESKWNKFKSFIGAGTRAGAVAGLIATGAVAENQTHAVTHVENAVQATLDKVTTGGDHVVNAGEEVADKVTTGTDKITTGGDHVLNAIVAPVEGTHDFLADKFGEKDPAPRPPDAVMIGTVEITSSDELNLRKSPSIPGKEEQNNTSDWSDITPAQESMVNGKMFYEPLNFKKGDKIVIKNPKVIYGQNPDGGAGHDSNSKWIEIVTVDKDGNPHARFIFLGAQTAGLVKTVAYEKTVDVADTKEANGVPIMQFESQPPATINSVSVVATNQ